MLSNTVTPSASNHLKTEANPPTPEMLRFMVLSAAKDPILFFGIDATLGCNHYQALINGFLQHTDGHKLHLELYKIFIEYHIYPINYIFHYGNSRAYKYAVGKMLEAFYLKLITLNEYITFFMDHLANLPFDKVINSSQANYINYLLAKLSKSNYHAISLAIFHLSEENVLRCFKAIEFALARDNMATKQAEDILLSANTNGETVFHHIIQAKPMLLTDYLLIVSRISIYSDKFHRKITFNKDSYLDWIEAYGNKAILKSYISYLYSSFPCQIAHQILYDQTRTKHEYRLFEIKESRIRNTLTECLLILGENKEYNKTVYASLKQKLAGTELQARWPKMDYLKDCPAKFFRPFESGKVKPAASPQGELAPPSFTL